MNTVPGTSEHTLNMILGFSLLAPVIVFAVFHILHKEREQQNHAARISTPKSRTSDKRATDFVKEQFKQVMGAIDALQIGMVTGKHSARWKTPQDINIKFAPKYIQAIDDRTSSMHGFFKIRYNPSSPAQLFTYDFDYVFVRIGRGGKHRLEKKGQGNGANSLARELIGLKKRIDEILKLAHEEDELADETREIKEIHDACKLHTEVIDNEFDLTVYDPISRSDKLVRTSIVELGFIEPEGRHPDFIVCVILNTGAIYKNAVHNIRRVSDLKSGEVAESAIAIRKLLVAHVGLRVNHHVSEYQPRDSVL